MPTRLILLLCLLFPFRGLADVRQLAAEPDIVAACLILEASDQGAKGMAGVMAVISNRAHGDPYRFAEIVLTPKQFTPFNDCQSSPAKVAARVLKAKADRNWSLATQLVEDAATGNLADNTGGANHFCSGDKKPWWARSMRLTAEIGTLSFYREE